MEEYINTTEKFEKATFRDYCYSYGLGSCDSCDSRVYAFGLLTKLITAGPIAWRE